MLNYKAIEIFTSESARYRNKSVAEAVIHFIKDLKIAARCIVTRGVAGCTESGEIATTRLEVLSFNLPIRIYILVPAMETERVLDGLNTMVPEGIIVLHDLNVVSYRARNAFFPRQLTVRDVMTPEPQSVMANTSLQEAATLLLSSIFTGLPVLNDQRQPIGVITRGDLIRKGGLLIRLGLLASSDHKHRDDISKQMATRQVSEIMSKPAIVIAENKPLAEAVNLMVEKNAKRLPVVNDAGYLTGIVSRLDIFRTVMREAPDWNAFRTQQIDITRLKCVRDILRRETQTVLPETPLDEVIRVIDRNDIQRVAVVDSEGRLRGLISDRDLLRFFKPEHDGIWRLLSRVKHHFKPESASEEIRLRLSETRADVIMTAELVTVNEEMLIEEAIGLMIAHGLKRLPVVDADGHFKGLISRYSLLQIGFDRLLREENPHVAI